jgi:site-specific DNA-methyltransferase (adenine-specific)
MIESNSVIQGDCLIEMQKIPDKSIDMILCDLPYGTTACKWDTIIPFEPLWEQYKRIIKDNGAIVLTASQPFTSALVMSNIKMFKYEWIWEKSLCSNFLNLKKQPAKRIENICVFYNKQPTYNPQKETGKPYEIKDTKNKIIPTQQKFGVSYRTKTINNGERYPSVIIKIANQNGLHPTQKPVALFEYLVKTYTNEGDLVLDNCAGSGTTGVACKNLNRNFILIEKEPEYIDIINNRLTPKEIK